MTALEMFSIPFGEAGGLSSNPPTLSSNPRALSSNPLALSSNFESLPTKLGSLPDNPKSLPTKLHLQDEAAHHLQRNFRHVRDTYLRPLMREGRLTMTNPDEPNDPQQAYRTVEDRG